MNFQKPIYASIITLAIIASGSQVALGQTISCFPVPAGMDPSTIILPPGVVYCPTEAVITTSPTPVVEAVVTASPTPVVAPVPVADTTPADATTPTSTSSTISGTVYEDHVGRGKNLGADKGKKKGHDKDSHERNHNAERLVMAGTISGNTLTVTAITSGHLEIGSVLSGEGILQAVKIVAFGTGKGGVGTYTIAPK